MIRILHTADLHLGVETYGRLDPATGLSSRVVDCLAVLDEAVQAALDQQADLFLFCGDAYKNREPSPTLQREFARRMGRLASSGVAVFLVVGNHDLPNALGRATTVEIFDTLAIKNIYVASRPGTYLVETRNGPLQVVALPWVTQSRLLSKEEHKGLSMDELNRLVENKLENILNNEVARLDPAMPAILAAHQLVSGARPSSESRMVLMQARDSLLMPSQVASPAFAYIALGHVHRHQVLNASPPVVYSGSLQRVDFGEEKEEKGYVMVEIRRGGPGDRPGIKPAAGSPCRGGPGDRPTSNSHSEGPGDHPTVDTPIGASAYLADYRLVPVAARPFLTIEVNAEDEEDPTVAVLKALDRQELQGTIVRLAIKVSAAGEGLLREAEISRALRDAHYVSISREVKREQRLRLGGRAAEELGPLEALALYLETKGAAQDKIQVLQDYARRLMGEDTAGAPHN
ncbi:MAG: exonuclease subunit SbcD [Dehalococcoidia bacterium]|nr:exonuclease subunit SbcD [Dehalococcoidia bacterium]